MTKIISTMFPLNSSKGINDVVKSVKKWLVSNWHYHITTENLKGLEQSEFYFENTTSKVRTLTYADDNKKLWSAQHETHQGAAIYQVEITTRKNNVGLTVAVSLDYRGPEYFKVNKPKVIEFLIDDLRMYDGSLLTVSTAPKYIKKDDGQFILDLLINDIDRKLPVVYVSAESEGNYPVIVNKLAKEIAGEGHVVVEPNRDFSFIMREILGNQNPYNGAIGIFLPYTSKIEKDGEIRQIRLLPNKTGDMYNATIEKVRRLSLFKSVPSELSFQGIEHILFMETMAKSKENMAKLKETDASIDEYMELWDMALDDNAKLVEENKKLAMQIEQLKIVRQYCEENNMVKSGECADNVILDINQQEMYPGEMYNFVLFCLELALKSVPKDTRKYDTIKAILDLNPQTKSKERERIVNVIEEALTQGKLDLLKKVDFEIVYGKKHPIVSQSFSKRSMPVPGTPGGGRSEQNTIADLKRLFLL